MIYDWDIVVGSDSLVVNETSQIALYSQLYSTQYRPVFSFMRCLFICKKRDARSCWLLKSMPSSFLNNLHFELEREGVTSSEIKFGCHTSIRSIGRFIPNVNVPWNRDWRALHMLQWSLLYNAIQMILYTKSVGCGWYAFHHFSRSEVYSKLNFILSQETLTGTTCSVN